MQEMEEKQKRMDGYTSREWSAQLRDDGEGEIMEMEKWSAYQLRDDGEGEMELEEIMVKWSWKKLWRNRVGREKWSTVEERNGDGVLKEAF